MSDWDGDAYLTFIKAAFAEAGYPVTTVLIGHNYAEITLRADPRPPPAVMFRVAALATLAGFDDELRACWPCYRVDHLAECDHDWRTQPQPTRAELHLRL